MAHSVGEQAARAVKNSEKKSAAALRTPEERMAAIRGSVAAKLYIIPDDIQFLLERFTQACFDNVDLQIKCGEALSLNASQATQIAELQAKVEEFRAVYEQENRNMALKVERIMPTEAEQQAEFQADADHATAIEDAG